MRLLCIIVVMIVVPTAALTGWIDPDTPTEYLKTGSLSSPGAKYSLVMSDEFESPERSFMDGHDPVWTALDKSDDDQTSSGKKSLHYYNSSNVYTEDGKLTIITNDEDTRWRDYNAYKAKYQEMKRTFKSGAVQVGAPSTFTALRRVMQVVLPLGAHDHAWRENRPYLDLYTQYVIPAF
jgi:hypothetical protein